MQKTSVELSSVEKNKILINKWLKLEFPYTLSIFYVYFDQIQYFFKILKTNFTIQCFSISLILRGNPEHGDGSLR